MHTTAAVIALHNETYLLQKSVIYNITNRIYFKGDGSFSKCLHTFLPNFNNYYPFKWSHIKNMFCYIKCIFVNIW